MELLKKVFNFASSPDYRFLILGYYGYKKNWTDERYLKRKYKILIGEELNLENPQTYNEKLQWLKIHDRKPEYTTMVDKNEAKDYIFKKLGESYTIPTLGVWDKFEDIDFDTLPNQFVLKCTHDSGGLTFCLDKSTFDYKKAKKRINSCLKRNYYYSGREWPYKDVKPRIIAEPLLKNTDNDVLTDYKFFCFEGEPKIMYASKDKAQNPTTDFYDMEGNLIDMRMRDPNSTDTPHPIPQNFEKMKQIATTLSQGLHHLRVDFYECNGKLYIGELTFFHCSGFAKISPKNWEQTMGDWIKLK